MVAGARLIQAADLPAEIATVAASFFQHLALFLFLWFVGRSFFARRSIAEVQFGMPAAAANAFYGAVRWILFGYILWLVPWGILLRPPFELEALNRAVTRKVAGTDVKFCTAEDLILHKIISEREQDLLDVRQLIDIRKAELDREYLDTRVKELADLLERPEILDTYRRAIDK